MTDPNDPTGAAPSPPPPPPNSPWRPPRQRESNTASIVVGLVLVAIGAWYFLEQTMGIRMPRFAWREVWPVLLILVGVFVVVRSFDRRT